MKIPWALEWSAYVATAAALAGFTFGAARWRQLARGQRVLTLWLGASAAADIATYTLESVLGNTQPIAQIWFVASVVLGLEVLASLQYSGSAALWFRGIGVAYGLVWAVLALSVESIHLYSTYASPLQGFVLLGASLAALLRRVAIGRRDFLDDPAFLVCIAFAAIGLVSAFQTLTAQMLMRQNRDFVAGYYTMSNVINALAALVLLTVLRMHAAGSLERHA